MASPDRKLGLTLGAIGLAGLGVVGGGVFLASANEVRRLQDEQSIANAISTGAENSRNQQIVSDLTESLWVSIAGGVTLFGSAGIAVGAGAVIYMNRKRPELLNATSSESQQKG